MKDFADQMLIKRRLYDVGGIISNRYIFNNVNEFSINKLKVFRMKLIDSNDKDVGDEFTGIQYDSKTPMTKNQILTLNTDIGDQKFIKIHRLDYHFDKYYSLTKTLILSGIQCEKLWFDLNDKIKLER